MNTAPLSCVFCGASFLDTITFGQHVTTPAHHAQTVKKYNAQAIKISDLDEELRRSKQRINNLANELDHTNHILAETEQNLRDSKHQMMLIERDSTEMQYAHTGLENRHDTLLEESIETSTKYYAQGDKLSETEQQLNICENKYDKLLMKFSILEKDHTRLETDYNMLRKSRVRADPTHVSKSTKQQEEIVASKYRSREDREKEKEKEREDKHAKKHNKHAKPSKHDPEEDEDDQEDYGCHKYRNSSHQTDSD